MHKELHVLLNAIEIAGAAIAQMQQGELGIHKKSNNDIVTKADLLANDILKSSLLTAFPHDGWLSEETVDDHSRLNCKRVWIVDPIDGTKEYAAGLPEYAISVCLVENCQPVIAAIYNPAAKKLFHAIAGQGAWQGDTKLSCRTAHHEKIILLASRTEYDKGKWDKYAQYFEIKKVGSIAYKLGLIANGTAHATLSLGNKNEWDIAAGTLLVTEAGGKVTNKHNSAITFNQPNSLVDGIVAASLKYSDEIFSFIKTQ